MEIKGFVQQRCDAVPKEKEFPLVKVGAVCVRRQCGARVRRPDIRQQVAVRPAEETPAPSRGRVRQHHVRRRSRSEIRTVGHCTIATAASWHPKPRCEQRPWRGCRRSCPKASAANRSKQRPRGGCRRGCPKAPTPNGSKQRPRRGRGRRGSPKAAAPSAAKPGWVHRPTPGSGEPAVQRCRRGSGRSGKHGWGCKSCRGAAFATVRPVRLPPIPTTGVVVLGAVMRV